MFLATAIVTHATFFGVEKSNSKAGRGYGFPLYRRKQCSTCLCLRVATEIAYAPSSKALERAEEDEL